jgi:hypothetical protein
MNKSNKLEIKQFPTCHKYNGIHYCIVGKASKILDNYPMKISPQVEEEAKNLYKTDEFVKKINWNSINTRS